MSDSIGGLAMKRGDQCCGQLTATKKQDQCLWSTRLSTTKAAAIAFALVHQQQHPQTELFVCHSFPSFSFVLYCALLALSQLAFDCNLRLDTKSLLFLFPFFFTSQTPNGSSDEGRETVRLRGKKTPWWPFRSGSMRLRQLKLQKQCLSYL